MVTCRKSEKIDTSVFINADKTIVGGSAENGIGLFSSNCLMCHGEEGTAINFGSDAKPEFLGTMPLIMLGNLSARFLTAIPAPLCRPAPIWSRLYRKSLTCWPSPRPCPPNQLTTYTWRIWSENWFLCLASKDKTSEVCSMTSEVCFCMGVSKSHWYTLLEQPIYQAGVRARVNTFSKYSFWK